MYDKKRIIKKNITLDWILSKVNVYDIYSHYIGEFKVGHIYKSPFRKDRNPSFGIFYSKTKNTLLFKDHGTGECGDVIKFISLFTGITAYEDILYNIVEKLNIKPNTKLDSSRAYIPEESTVIGVVRQNFTQIDIDYWNKFNISLQTLKKYKVDSIKYYLCNGIVKGIYKEDNPMYAYRIFNAFKIYRPLADKHAKWRTNTSQYDVQGYEQLPKKGDLLVITKSLKDIMVLHEMGIDAIAPSSESSFIPDTVLNDVLKRFKRVLVLFDRDATGMQQSRKISLKTGLHAFFINKRFKAKDISDAIKQNGFETIKKWIYETVKIAEITA